MAAEPAPLDQAVGRTSHQETGGERSSSRTPTVLWAAVSLMCLGLIGGALSLRNGIMSNVE